MGTVGEPLLSQKRFPHTPSENQSWNKLGLYINQLFPLILLILPIIALFIIAFSEGGLGETALSAMRL